MKILCVIDSIGSGGAQRQLIELAKGIQSYGHSVSFLVYHHEPFYLQELINYNIGYKCVDGNNYFKRTLRIRKHIRNGKYDAVISFLEAANFITTLSGFPFRKWKLILGERNANPNILVNKKLRFYRWFHFFADYIVSNSKSNIDLVKKINPYLKKNKFKVIYNLVDLNYWKSSRKHKYFKNKKYNIVVVASHEMRKNANGLIKALNSLDKHDLERLKISWYGRFDKSYQKSLDLIKKYNLSDVITFYPPTKNIKDIMESADVIALFSFYEGLPNVICEALSLGKPVMTSSVSDLSLILKNTRNILFDPTDTLSIVNAFHNLFNLDKTDLEKIEKSNKSLASNLFDSNKVVNAYLNLLVNE